ncbi:MAG: DNA primase [Bacteroidales bacterium]|jgi:DNA primase|nr:DNA primase [Bacteroidales bacterium]
MIKQGDITKIYDATNIVDVIGQFVRLRKRGVNYIGLCPFHNEKTPSFNVNTARGIFKCFGCGEGGDAVRFLMKHEHYSYPEALRWLANRYGIQIEEEQASAETLALQNERDAIFHVNEFAQKYFADLLFNDEEGRSIGLSYFKERELTEETIRLWGLGYCKDSWTDFTDNAIKQGYTTESLVKAGLTIEKEDTKKHYDRFRGRVIFPIYSVSGRPLGFTGRVLTSDKTKAKYVNSPESIVYSKGKVLFGLSLAKSHIAKEDLCYLVEGNMDAVMMSQQGVKNVVATSGTALTEEQIRLLKRYTNNVTVLYDGDAAGIHAAFRAIDMFLSQGLKVKIVLFPDNDDPDSFARKHTQDEFQQYIKEQAHDFIIFKTDLLLADAQDDPIKKAALVKEILVSISKIPDTIERAAYIQKCSSILQMKEDMLAKELVKILRIASYKQYKTEQQQEEHTFTENEPSAKLKDIEEPYPDDWQERSIIELLLNYSNTTTRQNVIVDEQGTIEQQRFMTAAYVVSDLINEGIKFDNPVWQVIFEIYHEYIANHNTLPDIKIFTSSENETLRKETTAILVDSDKYELSSQWQGKYNINIPDRFYPDIVDSHIKQTLLYLKWHKLEQRRTKLLADIKAASSEEQTISLLEELNLLTEGLRILRRELHNIAK